LAPFMRETSVASGLPAIAWVARHQQQIEERLAGQHERRATRGWLMGAR
jgi:hypothetical protein